VYYLAREEGGDRYLCSAFDILCVSGNEAGILVVVDTVGLGGHGGLCEMIYGTDYT
jgi:hypothetical protein